MRSERFYVNEKSTDTRRDFLNLSTFIPVSIYNRYIVLMYQSTSTSKGSLAERTAMCVIFEKVSNQLWKDIRTFWYTSGRTVRIRWLHNIPRTSYGQVCAVPGGGTSVSTRR